MRKGEIDPLSVRDSRVDDLKVCIQFVFTDQLIQFGLEFGMFGWLIVQVGRMPRHIEQYPSSFCVLAHKVKINKRIGPLGLFLGIERSRGHQRSVVMGPQVQVAGVDHRQDAGACCHDTELFDVRHRGNTYTPGLFSAISFLIFSTNSAAGMSSVFSFPRVRTFTFPASASLSPTTRRNGTFCMACSRILAFIFSLRASTSTRTPISLSCEATLFAYSAWRSLIGIIATCTGDSHTGKAPA